MELTEEMVSSELKAAFEKEDKKFKKLFAMPIEERVEHYFTTQVFSQEEWEEYLEEYEYDYDYILDKLKDEMPREYFLYFNDLLSEDEFDYFYDIAMSDL